MKVTRTEEEVKQLIIANTQVPQWITEAREYHIDWKALFYGEEYKSKLLRIEHIESEKRAVAREKYARPIKDLNEKLTRPIDNIYSAIGGSKNYPQLSDKERADLIKLISNIRDNKSLQKWFETYWAKDLYIVDPSGMIFLEYFKDEWIRPTYKSILSIRNYESDGQHVNWVLFDPMKIKNDLTNEIVEYWRYVDAATDMTFSKEGDTVTLVKEKTFVHPFGAVPALTCSNISRLGKHGKLSLFDKIKEDQEEFMRDQSILSLYKFQNGFSIPVRPGIICKECQGTGKKEHQKCETCNGTGELFKKDVTDELIIPIDINAETINFPSNLGFFIVPDMEIWNKYDEVLEKKTMSEYDALWGITIEKEQEQTATEIMLNAQPKINKLNELSDVAEFMEWQFTEWIANWMIPTKDKNKQIASIYYGRIYLIRTSEQITKELSEAIKNNLPDSIKYKLYVEYLTTKYKNDPESLNEELKKSCLEYWPFYSVKDVNDYLGPDSVKKKMLFTDWWESLTEADKMKDKKELEKMRDQWMEEMIEEISEKDEEKVEDDKLKQNKELYET